MNQTNGAWYPGFGEVELIRRMPVELRGFLSETAASDPLFISEYLIPALRRPDAYRRIMEDILGAVECQDPEFLGSALAGFNERGVSGLGASAIRTAASIKEKAKAAAAAMAERGKAARDLINAQSAAYRAGVEVSPSNPRGQQVASNVMSVISAARGASAEVKAAGGSVIEQVSAARQAVARAVAANQTGITESLKEGAEKISSAVDEKARSMWWYTAPWYRDVPAGLWPFTSTSFFDWMLGQVKKNGAGYFPEPPAGAPDLAHSAWWQIMLRVYGREKYPPPPEDSPLYAEYKEAYARATHPGGTFGAVARVLTAPIRFVARNAKAFGNILINVVGAVLSPFTGGASLVAAGLLTAANSARMAANAARAAKNAAAADAAQKQELASQQAAETERQVNEFYNSNQSWFQEHGITPDKWGTLNLDQKVAVIQAGASGSFPSDPQPILSAAGQSYGSAGGSLPSAPSSGGGGGYIPSYPVGPAPGGSSPQPLVRQPAGVPVQAGMFGGSALPLVVAGVGLALMFGKPYGKGARRTKRNPGRGMRRSA